jgi:hypothetical protein
MVVLAPSRFAQLLVAACTFVACSSAPRLERALAIQPGQRTTVRLLQVNGSLALSLRNASAQHLNAIYTENSHGIDPGAKVVDDVNLQTLLDLFSERGMFAAGLGAVPAGTRDALIVEQGERRWVWALSNDRLARRAAIERGSRDEQTFHEARAEFLALYNSSMAFHGTGTAKPNFDAEGRRAATDGAKARAKMMSLPQERR